MNAFTHPSRFSWIGYVIAIPAIVGIASAIIIMLANVVYQIRWKDYWREKLYEVMGTAALTKDHDLFNRSLLLKDSIERAPDVPLPGALGFYIFSYSLVQVILAWVADNVGWL